jgi:hypothetical protein
LDRSAFLVRQGYGAIAARAAIVCDLGIGSCVQSLTALRVVKPSWIKRQRAVSPELVMKEWLIFVTENAVILINGVALLTVIVGTIEACLNGLRLMFSSSSTNLMRETWVRFGRWLIAGLTFQQYNRDSHCPKLAGNWKTRCYRGDTHLPGLLPRARFG